MRDKHKEKVIEVAIQNYKDSVAFGFSSSTKNAINMMEEAYYMCSGFNIDGISELRKIIDEAKEKYKKELSRWKDNFKREGNKNENIIYWKKTIYIWRIEF